VSAALALGCHNTPPTQPADESSVPSMSRDVGAAPAGVSAESGAGPPPFDPGNFVDVIDNRFSPLEPGTRFIYIGDEDGEPLRNVTDVTRDRKNILGVHAIVVLDRLYKDGHLVEKTFDYFAQDKSGNVWYLGEDTKEFEDGKIVSTEGTWLAGRDGARAGIFMPANPRVGETTQQEFAPGVAEDMSTFVERGLTVTTPFGTLDRCLKTKDFTPLEPGALEVKFYCAGVGLAKGRDVKGGSVRLVLFRIRRF
jgi:hypothetical protein